MDGGPILGSRPTRTLFTKPTNIPRVYSDGRTRKTGYRPRVPRVSWAKYVGVESVQYIEMGHATKVDAEEPNNWDLGNAVREMEKNFSTDLQLLMPSTTNDRPLQNACRPRTPGLRKYARAHALQKKTFNQIWAGFI